MQNNTVFLLNPDNADILNGVRRASGGGKPLSRTIKLVLIAGVLAYLALTVVGVIWMVTTLADWSALNADGVITQARLIDRDTSIIRGQTSMMRTNDVTYYLIYQYTTPDGQTLEGEAQVTEQAYEDYVRNAPVQVLYLENTPTISRLAEENAFEFPRTPVFAGGETG